MGNFLEDFLFGTPDATTGVPSGGIPAVADFMWPFENTWVSSALDSTAGQVATSPVRAGAQVVGAGLTALDALESYALSRPVSTLLQAGNSSEKNLNPLYRDGIQWQDFVDMWNASEYISPARAFIGRPLIEQGFVAPDKSPQDSASEKEKADLLRAILNPYPTAGGVSREEYERAWDASPLGTVFSGFYDAAFLFAVGGKGVNAAARAAKKAAGLNTQIDELRQLNNLRDSITQHRDYRTSSGKTGKFTVPGRLIEDLAAETDVARVRSSQLLSNSIRPGSFNTDELSHLISRTKDEEMITELVLADRGDALALGRLFVSAPDHVWSLSHMNNKLAQEFAVGGQFVPSPQAAQVIKATFDSAIERDEFFRVARDMFMTNKIDDPLDTLDDAVESLDGVPATSARGQQLQGLTNDLEVAKGRLADAEAEGALPRSAQSLLASDEAAAEIRRLEAEIQGVKAAAPRLDEFQTLSQAEPGKLNALRGTGADFLPIGTEGFTPLANATGMAQRWLRRTVADARINRPNTFVEIPLGSRGSGPLTTLMFWAGNRQPLNVVSYTRLRPDEVVEEMMSYSRSARTLRQGTWTVTRKDPDTGVARNFAVASWQWRTDAIARIAASKTQGDVALDNTVRELQEELISVAVNKYNVPAQRAEEIIKGLQDQVDAAQAQVAQDGFFMDGSVRVMPDPVFMRQLPDSRMLMPLDDLDWALRINSTNRYATRGRGTRRVMRGGAATLDLIFKWFRTSILFRPAYVPKNSFAEPGLSEILADGSLVPQDGLANVIKRFGVNDARRGMQFKNALGDRVPFSSARKDASASQLMFATYLEKSRRLDELEAHIADLDSAGTSPATRTAHLGLAQVERKIVYGQVKSLERELDLIDDSWNQVDEVPTYAELSDRVAGLRAALTDPDFVTTASRRIDEIRDLAVSRQSGARDLAAALEEIKRLRTRRESLVTQRDGMFKRDGRRAAERDLKNPSRNKRQDLVDPENPDARVAPDWIEQLARVNDPRNTDSLRRIPGRGDGERRIESVIRSIFYLDEKIGDLESTARMLSSNRVPTSGLSAVEQAELDQLSALIFARGKIDIGDVNAQTVIDDISTKLDRIREDTFTLEPSALKEMQALRDELAALDGKRADLAGRIAARQLARERYKKRDFSGETDYEMNVGGFTYTIPSPFGTVNNYGSALRAEIGADLTAAQTMSGGRMNGSSAGMRWRNSGQGESITPFDPRYWDEMTYVINRHVSGDDFANLLLRGESDVEILKWFQSPTGKTYMDRMGWTYDQLRGGPKGSVPATPLGKGGKTDARITMFQDGIIAENRRLLGQYFPDPEFRRRLTESREWTPGEVQTALGPIEGLAPIYGTGLAFIGNPLARVNRTVNNGIDRVWRNLTVKPETRFGRSPFYTREYHRQMEREIRLAQDRGQVVDGAALQAMRNSADARTIKEVENTFYNVRRMTNPVFALRYITAFAAAAWNTAYRYTRLAYRNPGRATVLANTWMNILQFTGTDEDGNEVQSWKDAEYVVLSFPDEWNVPIDPDLKIDTNSINIGTQESGYLPTVTMGVSLALREKPDLETAIKDRYPEVWDAMFGYGTNTDPKYNVLGIPVDPFMASYQKKALILARNVEEIGGIQNPFFQEIGDEDWMRVVIQDYDYRMYQWAKDGQQGPMPTKEESYKNAQDYFIKGTLASWASPVALRLTPEGEFYRQEWYKLRAKFPNNFAAAVAQGRLMYGEEFFFFMQPTSSNRAGMPPTQDGFTIWQENQDILADLREKSPDRPNDLAQLLFLDEQSYNQADFSEVVYNWQFNAFIPGDTQPIRDRMTPQERQDDYKVGRSWSEWNAAVSKRDALMLQYGFKSLQPEGKSAWLYDQWESFESEFASDPENALWKANKSEIDTGKADRVIDGIDYLLRDRGFMSSIGKSLTWQTIKDYRLELFGAREAYAAADSTETRDAIAQQWDEFVRATYLPQAGNFSGYYERFLAGRDLTGTQVLDRALNTTGFPLPDEPIGGAQ